MEAFKTGFNKEKFEADHFGYKRGSREKYFNGWEDVRYHFGLSPYSCNERELKDGNMGKQLYDELCHVYGEDGMSKYFPAPEQEKKRMATLRFDMGSIMANGVGKQSVNQGDRMSHFGSTGSTDGMTDEEITELATLLCGSSADVARLTGRRIKY